MYYPLINNYSIRLLVIIAPIYEFFFFYSLMDESPTQEDHRVDNTNLLS